MKILMLDIETAPNTAYVWGLFKQNIAPGNLTESSYILCWSAKWVHKSTVYGDSCQNPKNYKRMMMGLHKLLDEADTVVHYYGSKFDIPTVNKEFVKLCIPPPSPYKQVDLKLVVGRVFRFESNKLDYIAEKLGFGKKMKTTFQLWIDCMNGDRKAWSYMKKYNRHDVVLLEKVYKRLTPWIAKPLGWR